MRRYLEMIGILLLATGTYLYRLNEPSYWLDEAISLQMSRDWEGLWQIFRTGEVNMWLYYIQLHFLQMGSQIEFYTRSFSVAFALLAVVLVYALVCRLFKNRDAAIIAALTMGLNAFMLRYAQETRGYSETLFFGLLATYCLVRGQESGRRAWWLAYSLWILVGMYLHFFIALLVLVHGLWLLSLKEKQWKNYIIGGGIATLAILSVFIVQPIIGNDQVDWIPPLRMQQFINFVGEITGESRALKILYACASLLAVVYFIRRRGEETQRLIWLYLLIPVLMTILISLLIKPVFVSRYLLIILPALACIVGLGAAQLPKRWMIGLFLALSLIASWRSDYFRIEDRNARPHNSIREVMSYLDTVGASDDLIMVKRLVVWPQVLEYYQWRFSIEAEILIYYDAPELPPSPHSRLWILQLAQTPIDESGLSAGYQLVASHNFNGLMLWEYSLVTATTKSYSH